MEYLNFESFQNKYEHENNSSFFPKTLDTNHCFSRHLLVNKYLKTKKPKFLYWAIEADPNVLVDPFCVETINHWTDLLSEDKTQKDTIQKLLINIGNALSKRRSLINCFHYDLGYVHFVKETISYISFEVHPPRRCFRLVENFEKIVHKINQIQILGGDLKLELESKFLIDDLNVDYSNKDNIAAQVISKLHNKLSKNKYDKSDLFLTPHIAEQTYKDAKTFTQGLEYIVDTFQIVDYWSPDKKR